MFKHWYIIVLLSIISGCASTQTESSYQANLNNLEICQQYIATYPALENRSNASMTDSETSSIISMIDEIRLRGLDEELCKQIVTENRKT